jgi:hypothetical protein
MGVNAKCNISAAAWVTGASSIADCQSQRPYWHEDTRRWIFKRPSPEEGNKTWGQIIHGVHSQRILARIVPILLPPLAEATRKLCFPAAENWQDYKSKNSKIENIATCPRMTTCENIRHRCATRERRRPSGSCRQIHLFTSKKPSPVST